MRGPFATAEFSSTSADGCVLETASLYATDSFTALEISVEDQCAGSTRTFKGGVDRDLLDVTRNLSSARISGTFNLVEVTDGGNVGSGTVAVDAKVAATGPRTLLRGRLDYLVYPFGTGTQIRVIQNGDDHSRVGSATGTILFGGHDYATDPGTGEIGTSRFSEIQHTTCCFPIEDGDPGGDDPGVPDGDV